jgi:hypothetical protein
MSEAAKICRNSLVCGRSARMSSTRPTTARPVAQASSSHRRQDDRQAAEERDLTSMPAIGLRQRNQPGGDGQPLDLRHQQQRQNEGGQGRPGNRPRHHATAFRASNRPYR